MDSRSPKNERDSSEKPQRPFSSSREKDDDDEEQSSRVSPSGPWLLLVVLLVIAVVYLFRQTPSSTGTRIPYSFFRQQVKQGNVTEVEFHGEVLTGKWKTPPENPKQDQSGKLPPEFNTVLPPAEVGDESLIGLLEDNGVAIEAEETDVGVGTQLLFWMLGPILLIGFFWYMMRRSADPMSGGGMLGNFIRSPARRFKPSEKINTFEDVAGMDQAKSDLQEVVEFLKNPEKFQQLGAHVPKGILLTGAPGTGKTLLGRATAGEAGVPFYSINGSEFIQMFVGVGASRVRDLFKTAKENAPCILFIDEIDAVGRVRGAGMGGGHDEREQTLNQILSEMDGFQQSEAVIVLAATNRPDVLDPALLRPGRFDRHVTIDRPNRKGRLGILKVHTRNIPLAEDVDLDDVAAGTIGFSGADLRNLVNEAALDATRNDKKQVDKDDFETARDRVMMGAEREKLINPHEREMTAYHESGHALLAWLMPEVDPVHKVTIIPRGRSLGLTQLLPDEERRNIGEKRLHAQLAMLLGGRAAEKLVFDEYSAGAEDDLKKATDLARRMVAHWGMSDIIGPVAFRQSEEHPFLGKELHEQRQFSEETARIVDNEVQRFLTSAAQTAQEILSEHRDSLERLAQTLLEKESLGKDDMVELIGQRVTVSSDNRA